MDNVNNNRSRNTDIPKPAKSSSNGWASPRVEYNAALDQFMASSPPDDMKASRDAINRFFEKVADWFDPEGAKKSR